jgi:hypothetical protein
MRLLTLFTLFCITLSAQSAEIVCAPPDSPSYDSHCSERLIINKYPKIFSREKTKLVIHLPQGQSSIFENPIDDEESRQPSYWLDDYLPKISGAIIHINVGESSRKILVNTITGQVTKIGGTPMLSPDGSRLLVYAMEIEFNFENYLAVYRVNSNKLEVEFDAGSAKFDGFSFFTEWGPSDVRWLSPTEVGFNKTSLDCAAGCGSGIKYKKVPQRLVLDTKATTQIKWHIEQMAE